MRVIRHILFFTICSGLLQGCASSGKLASKGSMSFREGSVRLTDNQKAREDSFFVSAETAKMMDNNKEAISDFDSCLRIDRSNAAAYYELSRLFNELENPGAALAFARQAVSLDSLNRWYQMALADAFMLNKQYSQAEEVFSLLHQRFPSNIDYMFNEGILLSGLSEYDSAHRIFDEIEQRTGISEQIIYQKQLIDIKQGRVEDAALEIRKLIAQDPYEPRYYGLLAQLFVSSDKSDEAFRVYREWLQKMPYNPQALIGMALYYKQKGDEDNYEATMSKAFANPDMNVDDQIAFVYPFLKYVEVDSTKKDEALMLCRMIIQAHPESAAAFALYGDMFNQCNEPDSALMEYHQSVTLDGSKPEVWQQVLLIYSRQQQNDSLLKISEEVIQRFPDDFQGYYFNGVVNLYMKNTRRAIVSLERALEIGTDDREMENRIYTLLGDAYNVEGNYQASDSFMIRSLEMNPHDPLVLNNFSYYLSVRGEKLDQAEKMSKMAVSLEPNNYAYEDTYAWVLYKQRRYKEARKWMEKSLLHPEAQNSPGYLEHYGDILFRLNKEDEAMKFWLLARQKGASSEILDREISEKKILE